MDWAAVPLSFEFGVEWIWIQLQKTVFSFSPLVGIFFHFLKEEHHTLGAEIFGAVTEFM